MNYLNTFEKPDVKLKYLIMAFAGWADAGEAATNTVKYIQRSLSAHPAKAMIRYFRLTRKSSTTSPRHVPIPSEPRMV